TLTGFQWDQVYPEVGPEGNLTITGRNFVMRASIDLYEKMIVPVSNGQAHSSGVEHVLCSRTDGSTRHLYYGTQPSFTLDGYAQCTIVADQRRIDAVSRTAEFSAPGLTAGLYEQQLAQLAASDDIAVINGSPEDAIIDARGDLLLIQGSVRPGPAYLLQRLGTTLGQTLSPTVFTEGLDGLLDTDSQKALREAALPIALMARIQNATNAGRLDFTGAFGTYYREIFFHIPFLIAHHLRSQQRFAA